MRIIDKRHETQAFYEIPVGDCLVFDDELYLVVEEMAGGFNAVNLSGGNGELQIFSDETKVAPVDVDIIIKK